MALSAFGVVVRHLRENRQFSLRELAQLADIDHAYIYRLETGEKESPSEETVARLIKVLKAGAREADMLRFLAKQPDADPALTEYVIKEDTTVTFDVFASAAGVRHRGVAPEPKELIDRIKRIVEG